MEHESKKSLEEIFQDTKVEKVDTVDNLKGRLFLMQWQSMCRVLFPMCVTDLSLCIDAYFMLWVK